MYFRICLGFGQFLFMNFFCSTLLLAAPLAPELLQSSSTLFTRRSTLPNFPIVISKFG